MGFAMRQKDGRFFPVLTCDTCHDTIDDWGYSVVTYEYMSDKPLLAAHVTHKGTCDRGSRLTEEREENRGWMELTDFIPQLLWNSDWGAKGKDSNGDNTVIVKVLPGF
jgi:hypothetical protein